MKEKVFPSLMILVGVTGVSGCASIPIHAGVKDVQTLVESRGEPHIRWNQGRPEDVAVAQAIQSMLKEELTVEDVVQIALLNNSDLQVTFEELGIAQADLVQAGLLWNPVFAGHVRFPNKSGGATNTEFSVSQNFLDLFLRPLRKKLAATQLDAVRLRVSDAVLNLSADVRAAYYTLQGAEHSRAMFEAVVQAAQAAAELAERQHAAGNINDLDLANEQAAFQQTKLDLTRSEAEVLAARERLNRLMGLSTDPSWKISQQLPQLTAMEPSPEELETLALTQRLDLAAARQEVQVFEQSLTLTRRGVVPAVNVGVDTERDPNRTTVTGPSFEVELPVFDRKQAAIARAEAQLRQARQRVAALETQARSEVRSARNRVLVARQMIERYQEIMIPLREKIVAESQRHYNFMLIGTFQLLQAKREEVQAYREYIEAFRDYWTARTDLGKAVGGRLVAAATSDHSVAEQTEPPKEATHHHHHGGGEPK